MEGDRRRPVSRSRVAAAAAARGMREEDRRPRAEEEEEGEEEEEETEQSEEDQSEHDESDDESEGDEEEDERRKAEIASLLARQQESPASFSVAMRLIALYKEAADLPKVRQAREALAALRPLPESFWLEWIDEEERLASGEELHEVSPTLCTGPRCCDDVDITPSSY